MKKTLRLLAMALAASGLYAAEDECCEEEISSLFEFTAGYRQDQLKIHVTPPSPDSFVVTENNWKNVEIVQERMTFKAETWCNTYSRAYFNYGRLVEFGHHLVSPSLVLDSSKTHHEKGRVYDAEYAFGFSLYLCDTFRITPVTGYSYHRAEFECHNRLPRTIVPVSAEEAAQNYSRVVCKQRTTWRAPFLGAEIEWHLCDSLRICVNGQYLWAHYNNHGKDKEKYLQTYRYKQRSNGKGAIFYGELGYAVCEGWEALLTGGYQYWDVKGGTDKTKYYGSIDTETKSHLDKVTWQSFEISAGLTYLF